jgi:hypothetical protein
LWSIPPPFHHHHFTISKTHPTVQFDLLTESI